MTVAGLVSAIDLNMYTFDLSVSLRIQGIPAFAPLTVRATLDMNNNDDERDLRLPHLHTLVCITGPLVNVERQVAHVDVDHVVVLPNYDNDVDDISVSGD